MGSLQTLTKSHPGKGTRYLCLVLAMLLAAALQIGCSTAPQHDSVAAAVSESSSSSPAPAAETGDGEPVVSSDSRQPSSDAISLEANGSKLSVALADTDAAKELMSKLSDGTLTLELNTYGGFEKVGPLGFSLPTDDKQVTAQPGDIMLYQGSQITVFIGSNTWTYTRLGHIEGTDASELTTILGDGDVTVTLSLE